MTTINIYLTFDGNCAEAFEYYKSIFGGEYAYISQFKDMPRQEGFVPVAKEFENHVMHVSLPISKETILMGSDKGGDWSPLLKMGTNFSISVNTGSKEETDRIFAELSKNGKIIMPLSETFWQSYFGLLIDKFGIQWMVSNQTAKEV